MRYINSRLTYLLNLLKIGATKYRIGRTGPLRQGKSTHRTDQDVVPTLRVKERSQAK